MSEQFFQRPHLAFCQRNQSDDRSLCGQSVNLKQLKNGSFVILFIVPTMAIAREGQGEKNTLCMYGAPSLPSWHAPKQKCLFIRTKYITLIPVSYIQKNCEISDFSKVFKSPSFYMFTLTNVVTP